MSSRAYSWVALLAVFCPFCSAVWAAVVITSPSQLPNAVPGEPYTFQLQVEGASGPVVWSVDSVDGEWVELETPQHFLGTSNATRVIEGYQTTKDVVLPFDFPFYGENYRKVRIGRAGNFGFRGVGEGGTDTSRFKMQAAAMAPLWSDLYLQPPKGPTQADGVYVEAVPWRFAVNWKGKKSSSEPLERNFQGVVYPRGEIEFNYGDGNHSLYRPVVGISAGDNQRYILSVKNGATDLDRAASSRFLASRWPPGLQLNPDTGMISGFPDEVGLFAFRVSADDKTNPPASKTLSIAVPFLSIPSGPFGLFVRKGEPGAISWYGAGIGDRVTVKLYRGGELLETILDDAPNDGGVLWQPPDEYPLADDYAVIVEDNSVPPLTNGVSLTIWDNKVLVPQCCPTVQEGVDFARESDTVLIRPGTYAENVFVNKKVTLAGGVGGETVLDGGGKRPALTLMTVNGVTIRDLTITNAGGDAVGAIYCAESAVTIQNCKILGNSATFGAGIFLSESNAFINGCEISGNQAEEAGGGMYALASEVVLENCVVKENTAREGGGLFFWYSVPQVVRTIVSKNQADRGAGILSDESAPVIVNCTIADNAATAGAGGIECQHPAPVLSAPLIINSIIWGNGVAISGGARMKVSYCDVEDTSLSGPEVNIFLPPMFVDSAAGDYHLAAGSPCIDRGKPETMYDDPDGSRSDMGAFGGTGYTPNHSWITHLFIESEERTGIYWLATALTDAIGQFAEDLLSGWSAGESLSPEEKWTHTSSSGWNRWRFFHVVPAEQAGRVRR